MNIEDLMADLRRDEGCSLQAYQDSRGYWTIGFGRLIDARLGGGISMAEAEDMLENDVERFLDELDAAIPDWRYYPESVQRGLANLAFNLGIPKLMKFQKMFAALDAGRYMQAAEEVLDSRYAKQVGPRAERIADLFRG
jgi:lysozyme